MGLYHASTRPDLEGVTLYGKVWVTPNRGYHFTLGWLPKRGYPQTYYLYEVEPLSVKKMIFGAYGDEILIIGSVKVIGRVDLDPLVIDHELSEEEVEALLAEGIMVE